MQWLQVNMLVLRFVIELNGRRHAVSTLLQCNWFHNYYTVILRIIFFTFWKVEQKACFLNVNLPTYQLILGLFTVCQFPHWLRITFVNSFSSVYNFQICNSFNKNKNTSATTYYDDAHVKKNPLSQINFFFFLNFNFNA